MRAYCPSCGGLLDETIEYTGDAGWCDKCRAAFAGGPRPVPGWVLGVVIAISQASILAT